jgi:hypothetical protein
MWSGLLLWFRHELPGIITREGILTTVVFGSVSEFYMSFWFAKLTRATDHLGSMTVNADCFSHALNLGQQYFGAKRSHTWKYVSALV